MTHAGVRLIQPWAVAVVTAAAAIAFIAAVPRDVFWGTDSGNRFVQLQQFLRTGTLEIDDPSRLIESSGAFTPAAGHHFLRQDSELYSFYAPWFSLVSAPFYRAFGNFGLFVIPIVSTLALIAIAGRLHGGPVAALLISATPLFFYTVVFWEHTLAVALSTAGVLLAMRNRPVAAGLLIAMSAVFREEGYIALAAVGIAMLLTASMRPQAVRFAAGAAIVVIPLWVANWTLYGHILGLHAAVYAGMHAGAAELAGNFIVYLFRYTSVPAVQIAVAVPLVALIALSGAHRSPRIDTIRTILLYTAALTSLLAVISLIGNDQPMRETVHTQALFGALPWVALIFAAPRAVPRFFAVAIAAGLIITPLLLHQRDIGVIWGPRHFLWLLPLLVVAAAASWPELPRRATSAGMILVAVAVVTNLFGIALLVRKLEFSDSILRTVREGGAQVIVTDVFWLPEDLAVVWFEREMALVRADDELAWVIGRLKNRGVNRVDFISSPQYSRLSMSGLSPLLEHATSRQRIGGSEPMLDVTIVRATLR